jgi:DNA-binding MurR/RpiR family transcriptional regulator
MATDQVLTSRLPNGVEGTVNSSGSGQLDLVEGRDALTDKILAALPQLSKKHEKIARFVLDHQDVVVFASASEVGIRTDTSAATVVRFCQALGYDGYLQLQAAVRDRVSSQWTGVQRIEERLTGPIADEDLVTRVFATDIHNVERTAALTAEERLQAAAAQIRQARQTLVVGSGLAAILVAFLAHSLQTIDLPVRSVTGGEEPLALALAFLQPEDVVVGISFRHNPRDVVNAIQEARAVGARSIGITNSELSPVNQLADHAFVVAMDGVAHNPSPVAAVSLLNALVAALSLGAPEETAQSLHQVDSAYRRSGLLDE